MKTVAKATEKKRKIFRVVNECLIRVIRMNDKMKSLLMPTFAVLALGLAPHFSQPHLFEKIEWLLNGEKTLALIDWFDVVMHGSPWVWLVFTILKLRNKEN